MRRRSFSFLIEAIESWSDLFLEEINPRNMGILLVTIGSVVLAWCVWKGETEISTRFWPSTKGSIIQVKKIGEKSNQKINQGPIYYQYSVGGKSFQGDRITLDYIMAKSLNRGIEFTHYPIGKEVVVFYNPKQPQEALLEPGFTMSNGILSLAGVMIGGLGFIILSGVHSHPPGCEH